MKKLFLITVVFSALLLIGCQENSITDPIQDAGSSEVQKQDYPHVQRGTMILEGILLDPSQTLNSYLQIRGGIDFVHEMMFVDPIPPAPQSYVSLNLSVNAEIRDPNSPNGRTWVISVRTEDIIYVPEEGIYLLEKSFPIQDRTDRLVLVCRFLVTTDGVGLSERWLAFQSDTFNKSGDSDPFPMPPVRVTEFD